MRITRRLVILMIATLLLGATPALAKGLALRINSPGNVVVERITDGRPHVIYRGKGNVSVPVPTPKAYTAQTYTDTYKVSQMNRHGLPLYTLTTNVSWRRNTAGKLYYVSRTGCGRVVGIGTWKLFGLCWNYDGISESRSSGDGGEVLFNHYKAKYSFGGDLAYKVVEIPNLTVAKTWLSCDVRYGNTESTVLEANDGSVVWWPIPAWLSSILYDVWGEYVPSYRSVS